MEEGTGKELVERAIKTLRDQGHYINAVVVEGVIHCDIDGRIRLSFEQMQAIGRGTETLASIEEKLKK